MQSYKIIKLLSIFVPHTLWKKSCEPDHFLGMHGYSTYRLEIISALSERGAYNLQLISATRGRGQVYKRLLFDVDSFLKSN